jgi:predicted RNA methylase
VADLGCGCGMLGIAALLLDAAQVVGVDVDGDALLLAHENCNELEVEMELIQASLTHLPWRGPIVDTVVMNPPFGTRCKGADMEFLAAALKVV